ncbi:MAG: PAS domain-containing protein [Deltaproteobacteria bacterium]|nr:PAS domain-containing protein [Deltaproteobacteria bacterium]
MNNDLANLLASTDIATLFLGRELRTARYTPSATRLFRLIPSDVGRPIGDTVTEIAGEDLAREARGVLDTLIPKEGEVRTREGIWYQMRILPYRTTENVIDGVVITFLEIDRLRRAEERLREAAEEAQAAREFAENIVNTVREPLLVLRSDLTVEAANRAFYRTFRVEERETLGKPLYELGDRQWDIPRLRELLEEVIPRDRVFEGFEVESTFAGLGRRTMLLNARLLSAGRGSDRILLAIEDVTGPPQSSETTH